MCQVRDAGGGRRERDSESRRVYTGTCAGRCAVGRVRVRRKARLCTSLHVFARLWASLHGHGRFQAAGSRRGADGKPAAATFAAKTTAPAVAAVDCVASACARAPRPRFPRRTAPEVRNCKASWTAESWTAGARVVRGAGSTAAQQQSSIPAHQAHQHSSTPGQQHTGAAAHRGSTHTQRHRQRHRQRHKQQHRRPGALGRLFGSLAVRADAPGSVRPVRLRAPVSWLRLMRAASSQQPAASSQQPPCESQQPALAAPQLRTTAAPQRPSPSAPAAPLPSSAFLRTPPCASTACINVHDPQTAPLRQLDGNRTSTLADHEPRRRRHTPPPPLAQHLTLVVVDRHGQEGRLAQRPRRGSAAPPQLAHTAWPSWAQTTE
jgi:hypothetical protein